MHDVETLQPDENIVEDVASLALEVEFNENTVEDVQEQLDICPWLYRHA